MPTETSHYAVIFTATRRDAPDDGYTETAVRMEELAREQPGFLGIESARGADGLGITVSYWASLEAIRMWGRQAEHLLAQKRGRNEWYQWYTLRVCRVEEVRAFDEGAADGRTDRADRGGNDTAGLTERRQPAGWYGITFSPCSAGNSWDSRVVRP